jgi:UPF0271 protein
MLLNLDGGEHDDEPEELWRLADVVCVACGGHAGDEASMARVVAVARAVGAHPSYPDREGFGRRTIAMAPAELEAAVREQCGRLAALARVQYVKPHGALYHDARVNPALAAAVIAGARAALGDGFAVIGPPTGALRDAAIAAGLRYLREGFADRATRPDGTLVPRSEPGALITDPARAAAQARFLALEHDTICIHADTPDALAIARAVRTAVDTAMLGERALRFARPPGVSPRALVRAARAWPGVIDVVVARDDVAIYFGRHLELGDLDALATLPPDTEPAREVELVATYGGEDLDEVARATGLSTAEVIERHASAVYTVDTIGFRPGFAYMTGLDPALAVPRRATPRPRVPAGALAIADIYTSVYPSESPGGWNLIGHVAEPMFSAAGARLQIGDRVRFSR